MKLKVRNRAGQIVEIRTGGELLLHLREKFGGVDSRSIKRYLAAENVSLKEVFRAFGIDDINRATAGSILSNDGSRPLFNAVIEDGLRIGFERQANWQALVARTVTATQLSQTHYELQKDEDEYTLRSIGQGAPIPVGTITVADKSIKMHKRGRGIEWTDEAKAMNIDLLALFLLLLGKKLGRDYENTAVYRLLNGYFDDGSDAAPTIGIRTANTIALGDIFYAYKYQEQELGFTATRMVMNLNMAETLVNMRDGAGSYLFSTDMRQGNFPTLMNADPFISSQMPNNRIMLVDTNFALVRHSYKDFGVEFERSAKTQVEGSYGTEISEFVPFEKDARLIVTTDVARPA